MTYLKILNLIYTESVEVEDLEKKVLLIDADPQANASSGLGVDGEL